MTIYTINDIRIEQDEVMALGMGIWWLERKLVPNRVKVYNINILADKADQVLKTKEKTVKNKPLEIKERIIG